MSGLIGDKEKAKFIFFGVEDEADLPKKTEMMNHFPECTYNVYKSWGHFRDTFDSLESLLHIKNRGIEAGRCWSQPRYISHAYRINTNVMPDSFFAMKYATALVGFYELSHEDLKELEILLKYWRAQIDLMESMDKSVHNFDLGKKAVDLLEVTDNSMSNPDEEAIEKLFGKYGEQAAEQLIQRMLTWQSKVKWQ